MKVIITVRYTEMVIPARCRKPRPQKGTAEITVNIREVSEDRAPVAFVVTEYDKEPRTVRLYGGKLYRQVQDMQPQYMTTKERDKNRPFWLNQAAAKCNWKELLKYWNGEWPLQKHKDYARKEAEQYIIVDGMAYKRTGEPYYYGMTFGLGHNHGGTGLFVGWTDHRNRKRVWGMSAANKESAISRVVGFALRRGDTDSVEHIKHPIEHIEVLMPSAIKRNYTNQDSNY